MCLSLVLVALDQRTNRWSKWHRFVLHQVPHGVVMCWDAVPASAEGFWCPPAWAPPGFSPSRMPWALFSCPVPQPSAGVVSAHSAQLLTAERGGPLACADFPVFCELMRTIHFLGIPVLLKKITTGCYNIWSRNVISQCLARKQYCILIFFCSAVKVAVCSNTQLVWGQDFWGMLRLVRFYLGSQFKWIYLEETLRLWQLLLVLAFVFTVRSSRHLFSNLSAQCRLLSSVSICTRRATAKLLFSVQTLPFCHAQQAGEFSESIVQSWCRHSANLRCSK